MFEDNTDNDNDEDLNNMFEYDKNCAISDMINDFLEPNEKDKEDRIENKKKNNDINPTIITKTYKDIENVALSTHHTKSNDLTHNPKSQTNVHLYNPLHTISINTNQ
eukprot:5998650-Ditylum_brightwellii.AAC.1